MCSLTGSDVTLRSTAQYRCIGFLYEKVTNKNDDDNKTVKFFLSRSCYSYRTESAS